MQKVQSAGFTMVELMVVVAIMGVLAALALAANAGNVRTQQLSNAALILARGLEEAHQAARTRGESVNVKLLGNRMELFTWDDANGDGVVDWTDGNANGRYDDGEGEVVVSLRTYDLERERDRVGNLPLRLESPRNTPIATACASGAGPGADPMLIRFLPRSGAAMSADLQPCRVRWWITNTQSGEFSYVDMLPSGSTLAAGATR